MKATIGLLIGFVASTAIAATMVVKVPSLSVANTNYVSEAIFTNGVTIGGVRNTAWPSGTSLSGVQFLLDPPLNLSGTSVDLSLTNRWFSKSLGANTTLTFANPTAGRSFSLILTNGASWTITFPTVTWMSGSAPVLDVGAGKVNVFSFYYDGSTYYGDVSQNANAQLNTLGAGITGIVNGTGSTYAAATSPQIQAALGQVYQATNANLTAWAALATSAKQDSTVGTVVNSGTPVVATVPYYADTTGTNIAPTSVTITALTNLNAGTVFINGLKVQGWGPASAGVTTNALSLEQADSNTAGNKIGIGAVDLQIGRNGATKVASGASSFAFGTNNTASSPYSFAGGTGSTAANTSALAMGNASSANGAYSFAFGDNNVANVSYTVALGSRAVSGILGQFSTASGQFAASGDAQQSIITARGTTAGATPATLSVDGSGTRIDIPANRTWCFRIQVAARTTDAGTGDEESAGYEITGLIERDNTAAGTRIVGSPTLTVIAEDDAAWTVAVSADTTNGGLVITCTGNNETTVRWVATIHLTQVGG